MFSSSSALSSSANSSSSLTSSTTTKVLDAIQSQSLEEKIPLTSKEEVEKKLASTLTQVQQNQTKRLDLTSTSLGRFYDLANTLSEQENEVLSLAVLKNDLLASGSLDNTIKLWDPKFVFLSVQHLAPILKALKTNTSVTQLNLNGHPRINDEIIDPLIEVFEKPGFFSFRRQNPTLKTIDLRKTGITQEGINKLLKSIQAQSLSIDIFSDGDVWWGMIAFLLSFSRAKRNNSIVDSGLDIAIGEFGPFLGVPPSQFVRSQSQSDSTSVKKNTPSPD